MLFLVCFRLNAPFRTRSSYDFTTAEGDPFESDWIRSTTQWVLWQAHADPAVSHIKFDAGVVGNRGFGRAWILAPADTSDFIAQFTMMYDGGTAALRFGWVDELDLGTGRYATGANGWFVEIDSSLNNIRHYSLVNGSLTTISTTGAGWDRPSSGSQYTYEVRLVPGDEGNDPQLTTSWGAPNVLTTTHVGLATPSEGYFGFWRYHGTGGASNFHVYGLELGLIPEPSTAVLMLFGFVALLAVRWRH